MPPGAALAVAGAVVLAFVLLLAWLARLHPYIGLFFGLAFLAVPVVQWFTFERRFFQSDGSAAGLVIFVVYAGLGIASASIGVAFAGSAFRRIARGESGTAILTRGQATALVLAIATTVAALLGYRYYAAQPYKVKRAQSTEDRVQQVVTVREAYPLAWKSRGGAPELRLAIPAGDLARESGSPEPSIKETKDGPHVVRLALPEAPDASMELHRDDYFVGDDLLMGLDAPRASRDPSTPESFWVRRDAGGWQFLGLQCKERTLADMPAARCYQPDAPLARWVPALFGLENVRMHAIQESSICKFGFRYRERIVKVAARGRCFSEPGLAMLTSAVAVLHRLGQDTRAPPDAAARMARAAAAVALCEEAAKAAPPAGTAGIAAHEASQRVEGRCANAERLAVAELASAPAEGAALALRAVEGAGDFGGRRQVPTIDAVLAALASSGRGESREALRAHALRIKLGGASAESTDAVLTLAPKVLAADDPLFDAISRLSLGEANAARNIVLLQAWHEKAASTAAGSDVALKARYRLCNARVSANVGREGLQACADELMAAWERRVAEGKPFDIFYGEAELAAALARMYYSSGFATEDFAGGLAGVRRVREKAAARLPADAAHAPLTTMFLDLEAQLAARARGSSR